MLSPEAGLPKSGVSPVEALSSVCRTRLQRMLQNAIAVYKLTMGDKCGSGHHVIAK